MRAILACTAAAISMAVTATATTPPAPDAPFVSIDGGMLSLADWRGQPVLVVNTASRCAYTGQYEGLQRLQDDFADAGLVVLAVPSDDFNQELDDAAAVKDFCDINFGLTLPMTDITHVRGADAHPFYAWVRKETGFEPTWNFNKVLIGQDGGVAATFGANADPASRRVRDAVRAALE